MSQIQVTIHATGTGTCLLPGTEATDGLTVTSSDGTVKEAFLSWKSVRQFLALKTHQGAPRPPLAAKPVADGTPQ